ncbi:TetR/AcrR family transcriptional regulator [Actinomadura kijaniata]|uniref:TetR/AcrR family transcriptional regulator n=1 Tax=Actinomadura kijaniata TaxID=46161 RepID=UPI003F196E0E
MSTEHTGTGDPVRTLELLWGVQDRPRRGPKPKLTVPRIVDRAVAIADAEGLEALSMRRIAEDLGVAPMSIYTYVPGKAELLDLMVDRVNGEQAPPEEGSWRERLEHIAHENWRLLHRHPWLLHVSAARPPMGPNLLDKYEYELAAVEGLGLTDVEMDSVVALVNGFVHSAARLSADVTQTERRTGMSDHQWWEKAAPVLSTLIDVDRYPLGARVGTAAGQAYDGPVGPEHAFEFGLARILDGIEVLIRSRR